MAEPGLTVVHRETRRWVQYNLRQKKTNTFFDVHGETLSEGSVSLSGHRSVLG